MYVCTLAGANDKAIGFGSTSLEVCTNSASDFLLILAIQDQWRRPETEAPVQTQKVKLAFPEDDLARMGGGGARDLEAALNADTAGLLSRPAFYFRLWQIRKHERQSHTAPVTGIQKLRAGEAWMD